MAMFTGVNDESSYHGGMDPEKVDQTKRWLQQNLPRYPMASRDQMEVEIDAMVCTNNPKPDGRYSYLNMCLLFGSFASDVHAPRYLFLD